MSAGSCFPVGESFFCPLSSSPQDILPPCLCSHGHLLTRTVSHIGFGAQPTLVQPHVTNYIGNNPTAISSHILRYCGISSFSTFLFLVEEGETFQPVIAHILLFSLLVLLCCFSPHPATTKTKVPRQGEVFVGEIQTKNERTESKTSANAQGTM